MAGLDFRLQDTGPSWAIAVADYVAPCFRLPNEAAVQPAAGSTLMADLKNREDAAMQDKSSGHEELGATARGGPTESPNTRVVVERWGNPEVLSLVRDDPAIVLESGEVLFKEGDAADGMYIVKSGVLRIRSGSVVYEDAVAGGIVGEMAIVEDVLPRSAMVYALGQSEVVKIGEQRFFAMVAETPTFARTVMRVLSRRLRHMDRLYQPDRLTRHVPS